MKAWFLHPYNEHIGYVIHAETRGKAKAIGMRYGLFFFFPDWCSLYAKRCPALDDKPITIQSMIDAGFDMTYEGEPITELDIQCNCDICIPITPEFIGVQLESGLIAHVAPDVIPETLAALDEMGKKILEAYDRGEL